MAQSEKGQLMAVCQELKESMKQNEARRVTEWADAGAIGVLESEQVKKAAQYIEQLDDMLIFCHPAIKEMLAPFLSDWPVHKFVTNDALTMDKIYIFPSESVRNGNIKVVFKDGDSKDGD